MLYSLLISLSFSLAKSIDSVNNPYYDEKSIRFVSKVVQNNFLDCSMFFVDGNVNKSSSLSSTSIPEETTTAITAKSESSYPTYLTQFTGKAIYSVHILSNTSFPRYSDIFRFSPHCSIVITQLFVINKEFQKLFSELLIPHHNEITRKDVDHYIFFTDSENTEREFLLSPLSQSIRYKLMLRSENNLLVGHTLCFYCNEGGSPKILEVDLGKENLFEDFTKNFNGHIVRVSANTGVPAILASEKVGDEWRNKHGVHVDVFEVVMKQFNFTYTTRPSTGFGKFPAGGSGLQLPNGTWIGCVGDVYYGKADLAMNIGPSTQRMATVTFSSSVLYVSISFVTAKPKIVHSWKTIFKAFDVGAWLSIAAASVFTGATILFFERCKKKRRKDASSAAETKSWTIGEAAFSLYGSFISQSSSDPSSAAGKVNFAFWLCFTLIVGVAYASKLTSFIMLPGTEILPKTFKQLTDKHYHFKWGASAGFRGGLGEMVFKNSANPSMRKIYQSMELQIDDANCAKKCLSSRQACIIWDRVGDYILTLNFSSSDGSHPFTAATDSTYFVPNNWITRKREIFLPNFNKVITSAYDSGLVERLMQMDWAKQRARKIKWEQDANISTDSLYNIKGPKPFTMANVMGSFYILFVGLISSTIYFIVELLKVTANRLIIKNSFPSPFRIKSLSVA